MNILLQSVFTQVSSETRLLVTSKWNGIIQYNCAIHLSNEKQVEWQTSHEVRKTHKSRASFKGMSHIDGRVNILGENTRR
jgi:hypothetical protein